jgi:LysM repeat protein
MSTSDSTSGSGGTGGSSSSETYTVRDGDTLYSIAGRLGVSVDSLAKANDLSDPSRIRVGQKLTLPG